MHADFNKLKRQIMKNSDQITDRELFASSAYADYQSHLAEAATRRYRSGVHVHIFWDESEDADVAYTDNTTISENAANSITASFPTRWLRSLSMTGLTAHECGHLLFTDFTALTLYLSTMENGHFYPCDPAPVSIRHQQYLKELTDAMENPTACRTLAQCASSIMNILEDVYIEARMCQRFPGTFQSGIHLNNQRFSEQIPSIQEQIDKKYQDFAIVVNLIIHYCKTGDINNVTGYTGEYLDLLDECLPFVSDSIYESDSKERFKATNEILLVLWEYIKPLIDEAEKAQEDGTPEQFLEEAKALLGGQIAGGTPLPNGSGKAKLKPRTKIDPASMKEGVAEAQKVVQEETGRIALEATTSLSVGTNPEIIHDSSYTGSGYQEAANDIKAVLTKLATDLTTLAYEEELSEELQKQSDNLQYGNIHKGIPITIHRMAQVDPSLRNLYDSIKSPLLRISKRLQQSVKDIMDRKRNGEKFSHLVYGRRLEPRLLVLGDGEYFSRTRLPNEPSEMAIGLLIDESGSMSSASRISMAQQTAIILYDFCRSLHIPITIYGHTEWSGVELYSYAEFDSLDGQDCYRLMDMCPRGCNRDGAALRYVAEHLCQRQEPVKILILISDGQPNGEGYEGTAAEADLRAIKKEYQKKGVILFAAAIGTDKERIKRIYQDGFLDITDLNKLPKLLPQLITQFIN